MKKTIALTLALLALPAFAASEDQQTLSRQVTADGQLYGTALACELPDEESQTLFDQHFNAAKDFSVSRKLAYAPAYFSTDYRTGIAAGKDSVAAVSTDAEARAKLCEDTRQKVAAALASHKQN